MTHIQQASDLLLSQEVGSISLVATNTDTGAITLNASATAGGIDIDAGTGGINIDTSTGAIEIGTGATAKTITIGNTTGATALVLNSGTGGVTLSGAIAGNKRNVELVTVNDALTEAESGKLFVFNDADGAVLTLPDSGGGDLVGVYYDFFINTTAITNAHKVVCTDTANEVMLGMLSNSNTGTGNDVNFASGANHSAISCNGSTTGIKGSSWRLTNIAADVWKAEGNILSTGTAATSFATS